MSVRSAFSTFRGHRVPNVDFMGRKNWWFALSGFFIVISLVGLFARGLNFSIEFKGGALLVFPDRSGASVAQFQSIMAGYGQGDAQVEILSGTQNCGATQSEECVNIRTQSLTQLGLRADQLRADLSRQAGISSDQINETDVGPTWGSTISRKALIGLVIFLILVTIYITLRFEWKMAVAALAALVHDLIITAGIYALVGREVTPETVIAILTILGYSLYDDVVIFDKIKENTESAAVVARDTYAGVANMSLNQTLMRSVNTSLVVLFPIGALLLFGGTTLKDFAFALFVGVASGTYSSIFVAAPILTILKENEPRYQQIRQRATARAARPGLRGIPARESQAAASAVGDGEVDRLEQPVAAVPGSRSTSQLTGGRPRAAGSKTATRKKKSKSRGKSKPRRR
jgi:preprotein translocase subunit SecF